MNNKMNIIIESLSKNPWLIVLSAIITFASLIVAIIFYYRGRKVKKAKTAIRSINLFKEAADKIDGLEITYSKTPVSNLTITKLAIWNDGNETINGNDIAPADPLLIKIKGDYIILETKLIYTKNESNVLALHEIENGKQIAVTLDYLDKNDGGVIQILHTGYSSSDIEFTGTIKGVGKINAKKSKIKMNFMKKFPFPTSRYRANKIVGFTAIVFAIISPLLLLINPIETKVPNPQERKIITVVTSGFISGTYLLLGYSLIKKKVPKGFEIFEESF